VNERIKLPDQEWLGYDPERGDLHGYTFEQMREFAESIIKECTDVLNKRFVGDLNREDMEVRRCIADIKRHFGVEE